MIKKIKGGLKATTTNRTTNTRRRSGGGIGDGAIITAHDADDDTE